MKLLSTPLTHAFTRAESITSSSGLGASALPPQLLAQVRQRLRAVALIFIVMPIMGGLAMAILGPQVAPEDAFNHILSARSLMFFATGLMSAVFFGLTFSERISDARLADLGMLYEVLLAFGASWARQSIPFLGPEHPPNGLSIVCLVVLIFPLVVPNTVKRATLAGLIAASMEPLVMAIMSAQGRPPFDTLLAIGYVAPNFICALVATVPMRFLIRMGRAAEKAQELGAYQLTERLGQGGMGEVWRAEHRLLRRPAAVKLVTMDRLVSGSGSDRDNMLKRFEREAQVTASLYSPHTINLFDFGVSDDGRFYYVMELLDGLDLESLVEQFGPVEPERVVHIMRQACDSLIDAHRAGLIHRDIKPANIYLCRYGHHLDFVKVLDFGLVKLDEQVMQTRLTSEGAMAGTPGYMPPELALGQSEIDARADLYSLGCVAYWLLTGDLVFEDESAMKVVIHHIQTPPEPPSARSEADIPAELEAVIMDCLAKDPDDRPRDAADLLRRLEEIPLSSDWSSQRAERWWSRHLPQKSRASGERSAVKSGGKAPAKKALADAEVS